MPNPLQSAQALQALKKSPPSFDPTERELYELAKRDPSSVKPGSNEYWASELESQKKDHDILHASELSNILGVSKANTDAQIAGFTGNPVYKTGPSSYESHDPSLDEIGPTPASPTQRPTMMPSHQAAASGRAMETYKAGVPLEQQRLKNTQNEAELDILRRYLTPGQPLPPGFNLKAGGVSVGQDKQSVQNQIDKQIADAEGRRGNIAATKNPFVDWLGGTALGPALNIKTSAQQLSAIDEEINRLNQQKGNPAVPSHDPIPPPVQAGGTVRMIAPDGTPGNVRSERAEEALAKGYKYEGQ